MSYHCIVILREILDTRDLVGKILDDAGNLLMENLVTRMAPEDMNALEMALSIKDTYGGSVTVLSLGRPKDVDVLREALYRGADNVMRLDMDDIGKLDTSAVAHIYARAIQKLSPYDLILTGVDIAEGENALLGVAVSELLNIEHISYVDNLESIENQKVICKRAIEMGYEVIASQLPALINAGVALQKDDPRSPRSAKAVLKLKKKKVPIEILTAETLKVDDLAEHQFVFHGGYEPMEPKKIESKKVDPESDAELKELITTILSGS